ncbi:MAG: T9SS type A sorting domain-containing protein, partial [Bacteroidia bacterium]|nr:T9SS type A sorting domain-containing protein [Bacteroidia bacterium]
WIVKDLLDDGTYKLRVETQGVAPFTYYWSHNDASGTTVTDDYFYATETGEYCVTVYDARQCASTVCIDIQIVPTCDSWIEKILLDDGTYEFIVHTEGEGPFTYSWSDSTSNPNDLSSRIIMESGNYCVVVIDANQCTTEACIEIEFPNPVDSCDLDIISTTYASDFVIELKADPKGVAPFQYFWSDGSFGNAIEVTISTEYCLKVIDANGCIAEKCIPVEVPQRPCTAEILRTDNSSTTSITLEAHSDGVHPLTYSWGDGSDDNIITVSETGEYCVKITDANGCESYDCINIEIEPVCYTEITRGANSTVDEIILEAHTEGMAPFVYNWSNGSDDQKIKVQESGEYCVKVVDAQGCESYACVVVEIEVPVCEVKIDKGANSTDYVIVLEANPAGVGPFTFEWTDGTDGSFIVVDNSGEYCVKVIDARGCVSSTCLSVEIPEPFCESKAFILEQDDQKAKIGVETNGYAPFEYYWDNGETSAFISVSHSGEYCVEVIDALGCISYSCILVDIPDYEGCETKIELIANSDSSEFKIIAHTSGVGPFKYYWANGDTSRFFYPELDGEYCVKVIDINGCVSEACLKVEGVTPSVDLNVYPNPAPTGEFHVVVDSELNFEAIVEIRDINGNLLFTTTINIDEGIQSLDFDNDAYPVGVFFVNIIRGSNIESIRVVKMGD